jgi:hypothetical protein
MVRYGKKIARGAFDAALQRERAAIMSKFKKLAASASTPGDMWAVEEYLNSRRRKIEHSTCRRFAEYIAMAHPPFQ